MEVVEILKFSIANQEGLSDWTGRYSLAWPHPPNKSISVWLERVKLLAQGLLLLLIRSEDDRMND